MARLKDIIPLLSSTQYKKAQVLVRYDDERYIDGYETKQEQFISGYGTKTEQYITGYHKKTITQINGNDPYQYNAYTNNKIGCTTNKYATSANRTNPRATNSTCKLINSRYVDTNNAYINILNRCVESSVAASHHINAGLGRYGGNISSSIINVLENNNDSSEDKEEYLNPQRRANRCGVYNLNSTGATVVTRQVDDKSRPIYASRQVTDYSKPIYSTRTVTDSSKPIYKTRKVPVYEERWVEE